MTPSILPIAPALLESFFAHAPLGVAIIDHQGILLWINPLAREFFGTTIEEGRIILQSKDWPLFRQHLLNGKPFYFQLNDQGYAFTPQALDPENQFTLLWILPSASMEVDLVAMQRDLMQQRKMANLGRMMSEMAHELKNPLAGISMGTQLIGLSAKKLRRLIENTEALEILGRMESELEKVTKSTGKAATLSRDLLTYSKPNELNLRPYQLGKLLQSILTDIKQQPVFHAMTFEEHLLPEPPSILCDPGKLEQIVYNLVKNAHEATHGQGVLRITENTEDNKVILSFEDNGPGIPEAMLDKIFSPFLTTKPQQGTGLGLSISQQIIQQHGGAFSVYNKPQSGACFQITFPIFKFPEK